ncbi:MAG: hypothetical protein HY831_03020 [Candidatus Aenigmarchaeota archaeon]|nr:hypothetical protein [Candidatus Aenigmarchaeota archaeon]
MNFEKVRSKLNENVRKIGNDYKQGIGDVLTYEVNLQKTFNTALLALGIGAVALSYDISRTNYQNVLSKDVVSGRVICLYEQESRGIFATVEFDREREEDNVFSRVQTFRLLGSKDQRIDKNSELVLKPRKYEKYHDGSGATVADVVVVDDVPMRRLNSDHYVRR